MQCWPRYVFVGKPVLVLYMSGSLFLNRVQYHRIIVALFVKCWLGSSFMAWGTTLNRGRNGLEHCHYFTEALKAIHYVKDTVLLLLLLFLLFTKRIFFFLEKAISQHLLQQSIVTSGMWLIRENLTGTERHYSLALLKVPVYSTELVAVIFVWKVLVKCTKALAAILFFHGECVNLTIS